MFFLLWGRWILSGCFPDEGVRKAIGKGIPPFPSNAVIKKCVLYFFYWEIRKGRIYRGVDRVIDTVASPKEVCEYVV
jgi:hypothetical protein